jgi:hypothetical protein
VSVLGYGLVMLAAGLSFMLFRHLYGGQRKDKTKQKWRKLMSAAAIVWLWARGKKQTEIQYRDRTEDTDARKRSTVARDSQAGEKDPGAAGHPGSPPAVH